MCCQLWAHSAISVPHHLWSAARLIGSVYLIGSLPAALYKSFIFSFKIRVIFVKLLRHIFSILQYYFAMREWKAWDSLLDVTGFPYCNLMCCQLCALRAPGFGRGKHNACFDWTQFKISVIFVKIMCSKFFDFAILFSKREWKACNSLLGVTGFPYCRLIQSQLCALRAPGFWGGKRNARFAWTRFKISVIFVKLLRRIFS